MSFRYHFRREINFNYIREAPNENSSFSLLKIEKCECRSTSTLDAISWKVSQRQNLIWCECEVFSNSLVSRIFFFFPPDQLSNMRMHQKYVENIAFFPLVSGYLFNS